MTLKPDGLVIHAIPRANKPPFVGSVQGSTPIQPVQTTSTNAAVEETNGKVDGKQRLNVLYGSNTGSSEAFAQRVASSASGKGKSVTSCLTLLSILVLRSSF